MGQCCVFENVLVRKEAFVLVKHMTIFHVIPVPVQVKMIFLQETDITIQISLFSKAGNQATLFVHV